jgi:hypothetical protein
MVAQGWLPCIRGAVLVTWGTAERLQLAATFSIEEQRGGNSRWRRVGHGDGDGEWRWTGHGSRAMECFSCTNGRRIKPRRTWPWRPIISAECEAVTEQLWCGRVRGHEPSWAVGKRALPLKLFPKFQNQHKFCNSN